ncbi:MAG: hypothetical protein HQ551_01615 [Desulfobacteraceae bacterium]|nr:hypothetical protein [Desulfobacteraceae bacterium]
MINKQMDNHYVREQIDYTTSLKTRPGWKMRYNFAIQHISATMLCSTAPAGWERTPI